MILNLTAEISPKISKQINYPEETGTTSSNTLYNASCDTIVTDINICKDTITHNTDAPFGRNIQSGIRDKREKNNLVNQLPAQIILMI